MCKSIEQSSLVRERLGKLTRYAGIATALGLVGSAIVGCDSETPPATGSSAGGTVAADSTPGSGGSSQTKKSTAPSNRGGAASASTTKTKTTNTGGSRSEGGASSEEGGAASSEEGGADANGGTSSERTSSARAKGGATSKASTTTKAPAAGGSSPSSGGSSSRNTGGATGTKTSGAQGGSSAVGGATATGGGASTSAPSTGTCTPSTKKFSFFVTSQKRLFALAKAFNSSDKGFGGDLRYGETGDDAGLKGADKICREIAEQAQPGNCKTWRAFLSTSKVNAIDRIGKGPWYDAFGNLFGNSPTEIISDIRPPSAHASIKNDFPNEDGIPNHDALQTGNTQNQDNHDFLTGTGEDGKLYQGSTNTNCKDWTSQDKAIRPRVGHSWPRAGMGNMSKTDTTTTTGGGGFTMPGSGATMATMNSWVSSLDENGCAPGINLSESSIPMGTDQGGDGTVGGGGGYGGIYCFAEEP